ncbi:MAG: transpeptidase family protein [Acidobacteria bacterium]|nr:transpeptidase family protein [Acidobacteriota bacterium]
MSRLADSIRQPWGRRSTRRRRAAAHAPRPEWRDTLKRRVLVAAWAFAIWVVAIEARLVHLQVVQHAELVARAGSQQRRTIEVHSKRGEILDRNGRVLAYSVDADTVYAVPTDIDEPAATARALCNALTECTRVDRDALERRLHRRRSFALLKSDPSSEEARRVAALGLASAGIDPDTGAVYAVPSRIEDEELEATASAICGALDDCAGAGRDDLARRLRRPRDFAYVQRKVSPEEARRVAALGLDGVGFLTEDRRYYPGRELAAHLIGYVGLDNQGLSGIESTYDSEIGGRAGQILVHTDARRRAFSRIDRPPTAGATVELTIDKHLQHIAERELRAGIRTYDADAGAVVMLDPRTGEVLALASAPSFNPNVFGAATPAQRRNRAVQDVYEPGSTFKIVTAAAAFEEDAVQPDEVFDVSAGFIRIGRNRINDFTTYGPLSFTDVIVKSSNVGAILVGLRLGPERLSRYVDRFGFGRALSRDFPGESAGLVWSAETLNDRAIASIAMGYQIAVTPLQMAAAFAAVANGGELLEPRVVRTVARNGGRVQSERRVIRRSISRETAAALTGIMTQVAERGTARRARVPGYAVAGKTGTAEKLIDGRYSHTDHNASFVGFVPADAPRLVVLVMLDTPRTAMINGIRQRAYTGGAAAAPVFQRIAEAALRYLRVPRTQDSTRPPLVARSAPARDADLRPAAWSESAGAPLPARSAVASEDAGSIPDLRGLSARQAVEVLGRIGLRAEFNGDGAVARHVPAAGEAVDPGATVTVWLQRYAPPADDAEALGP